MTLYEMGTIKDVTAVGDGANRLMLRRETVADLLSLETESEVR
ncbi:MAG: hypothetical protein ACRD0H_05945 [Actinomycetes bacterium]